MIGVKVLRSPSGSWNGSKRAQRGRSFTGWTPVFCYFLGYNREYPIYPCRVCSHRSLHKVKVSLSRKRTNLLIFWRKKGCCFPYNSELFSIIFISFSIEFAVYRCKSEGRHCQRNGNEGDVRANKSFWTRKVTGSDRHRRVDITKSRDRFNWYNQKSVDKGRNKVLRVLEPMALKRQVVRALQMLQPEYVIINVF